MTSALFRAVGVGGRLLIANFTPGTSDAPFMEAFMDSRLVYRDERQMMELTSVIREQGIDASASSTTPKAMSPICARCGDERGPRSPKTIAAPTLSVSDVRRAIDADVSRSLPVALALVVLDVLTYAAAIAGVMVASTWALEIAGPPPAW